MLNDSILRKCIQTLNSAWSYVNYTIRQYAFSYSQQSSDLPAN